VRYGGKRALAIGVSMAKGGDIILLGKELDDRLSTLRSNLPLGVEISEAAASPMPSSARSALSSSHWPRQ
jgi:multidrug efflux pump